MESGVVVGVMKYGSFNNFKFNIRCINSKKSTLLALTSSHSSSSPGVESNKSNMWQALRATRIVFNLSFRFYFVYYLSFKDQKMKNFYS